MHHQTIEAIVDEIGSQLSGRFMGKIYQLSPLSLAIDFGLKQAGCLFISVEPATPRLYLIRRPARELQKQSIPPLPFVQAMRSQLGGGRLLSITKDNDRIVRLAFLIEDDAGDSHNRSLVAQLTGRSTNLFLLDSHGRITHALRDLKGEGQQTAEQYLPPALRQPKTVGAKLGSEAGRPESSSTGGEREEKPFERGTFPTLSAAAEDYYGRRDSAEMFAARAKALLGNLKKELAQCAKLQTNLRKDSIAHGDPEQHKRMGDLLLANIANARREGNKVTLKDYYREGQPEIEIEVDENSSLQDEAARYFTRYTKAKRAREKIASRLAQMAVTTTRLEERETELQRIIDTRDEPALTLFASPGEIGGGKKDKKKPAEKMPGVRRYSSSDGYEILVGRAAHTNDHLTFRVARPHDLWLHAADYPGSHVVIRNHTRKEIPHRTIIEAAQLAAKFSQAGDDSKVTVHYTPRKFLSKPKGAAPGLVRMSSVRTVVVQPGENIQRI